MIERNTFLGGHLVGIGKKKANGEIIYQELDKPIHNRITSVGLDHMFQFAGPNHPSFDLQTAGSTGFSYVPFFYDYGGNSTVGYRSGFLRYVAFGSGTAQTTFDMTALQNGFGTYYDTLFYVENSNQNLNKTRVDSFGNYAHRKSHQSSVFSETTTVNEIGWFGSYGDSTSSIADGATPVLFARVVLPSPIVVEAGESLITTYELQETQASSSDITHISNFCNMLDSNGNTLQADSRIYRYVSVDSRNYGANPITSPCISYQGKDIENVPNYYAAGCAFVPPFWYISAGSSSSITFYSTSSTKTIPNIGTYDSSSLSDFGTGTYTGVEFTASVLAYTGVGSTNKYRDRTFTFGAYCPSMSGQPDAYKDIYFIRINGTDYRFGYDDNGTWIPQAWRKYANERYVFTMRTRYSTEDTTNS